MSTVANAISVSLSDLYLSEFESTNISLASSTIS